jgi:hypothetical protein
MKNDGFAKDPSALLCFVFRHSNVLSVRLIPQDSHALHMKLLQSRHLIGWFVHTWKDWREANHGLPGRREHVS